MNSIFNESNKDVLDTVLKLQDSLAKDPNNEEIKKALRELKR